MIFLALLWDSRLRFCNAVVEKTFQKGARAKRWWVTLKREPGLRGGGCSDIKTG